MTAPQVEIVSRPRRRSRWKRVVAIIFGIFVLLFVGGPTVGYLYLNYTAYRELPAVIAELDELLPDSIYLYTISNRGISLGRAPSVLGTQLRALDSPLSEVADKHSLVQPSAAVSKRVFGRGLAQSVASFKWMNQRGFAMPENCYQRIVVFSVHHPCCDPCQLIRQVKQFCSLASIKKLRSYNLEMGRFVVYGVRWRWSWRAFLDYLIWIACGAVCR